MSSPTVSTILSRIAEQSESRLIPFGWPQGQSEKGTGTFDFLGFTHYWGKTRRGGWTIKRKTRRVRLRRAHKAIWAWCRDHRRHWDLREQYRCLSAKLRGHYAYYGIRGNYEALEVVYEYVDKAGSIGWAGGRGIDTSRMRYGTRIIGRYFHCRSRGSFSHAGCGRQRSCARGGRPSRVFSRRRGTEEPDEGNLHVRDCGGRRGQPRLLPGTEAADPGIFAVDSNRAAAR